MKAFASSVSRFMNLTQLKKIITVSSKNPFIYGYLSKATGFMVTSKIILNAHINCGIDGNHMMW